MGERTAIGWTDHTFNPWWGCQRVSPACQHCYAETFAKRTGNAVWGKTAPRRFFGDKHWSEPLKWNTAAEKAGRPALVFCASMADVFEDRPDLDVHRERLWELIDATPWLRWQLLTKRPEHVIAMTPWTIFPGNVWIGTTVEDQDRAVERIPHLLRIPAVVRFLSCEPLLGELDLSRFLNLEWMDALGVPDEPSSFRGDGGWGAEMFAVRAGRLGGGIHWIIVGGESGPGHRPLNLDHARDVVDQARAADVPVFFKQVGGQFPTSGGDLLDNRLWKQFPASWDVVRFADHTVEAQQ
jgi:protein gp37